VRRRNEGIKFAALSLEPSTQWALGSCPRAAILVNPGLLGLIAAMAWGVHDVIGARASSNIGAVKTATAVTVFGLMLLTLWIALTGAFPAEAVDRMWLPVASGVLLALATIWLFAAMTTGSVSLTLPIVMSYPATSLILGAVAGRPPSFWQIGFAALVIAGVIAVAKTGTEQNEAAGSVRRAILFAVLSHFTFAIGNFIGQYAATIYGAIPATWLSRLGGSAAIVPLLFLTTTEPGKFPTGWLPFLLLMGGLDVLALSMLNLGGHTAQPELTIVTASAAGVIAIILAWLFLKERIAPLRWIGIIVTFAGVAALTASN
jgi:drug/metabolite transporter (DMT)-like permease